MRKSDISCPKCGAGYRRIELLSRPGTRGEFLCVVSQSCRPRRGQAEIEHKGHVEKDSYALEKYQSCMRTASA